MKSCPRPKRTRFPNHLFFARILGALGLLFLLLSNQSAMGKTDPGVIIKLTEPENWVLAQIKQGKEADLKKQFPGKEEKYLLSAAFLERLLTGGFKNIQISHRGVKIANATIEGDLNLENAEINPPVNLEHCTFKGKVILQKSCFKKDLSLQGSEFLNSANFKGITVERNAICEDAHFWGESLWSDAKIGEQLKAERAEFHSCKAKADFDSIKVGEYAFFNAAIFHGPVIFDHANIGKQFFADEAKFLNRKETASFATIMTAYTIFFKKAEFYGPVDFTYAKIGVNFRASGAKFLNETQLKNFSHLKVNQKIFMDGVFIRGDLDFSDADSYDLDIDATPKAGLDKQEGNIAIHSLKLNGALIQHDLNIAHASIDEFYGNQMQVKGHATINNTQIKGLLSLRSANFQTLDFENIKWPEVPQKERGKGAKKPFRYEVYLGDLIYNSLSIDKPECDDSAKPCDSDYKEPDFNRILDFMDLCPFYTQSYVQLETFFKRIGHDNWANEVFMDMHNRELAEKMKVYDPRRWLEWFFWGKIAGYGRAPFRVFFLALAFIILGACLFDPEYLVANRRPPENKVLHAVAIRMLLSIDRFLPIELGLAKHWESSGANFLTWLYFYLQQILGWILIPIALASIYSQIK